MSSGAGGSGKPTGSQILRLVTIMDRLRSPGGCPWDAEQTHQSLSEYLLEETYETLAAIEDGQVADLVEELGDLLLQVVFHSRLGQEEDPAWNIDDVAAGISEKLVRRHPHVFGERSGAGTEDARPDQAEEAGPEHAEESATAAAELSRNWTRAKTLEKGRTSALDGIPHAMPALALAQKTWRRAAESGLSLAAPEPTDRLMDPDQPMDTGQLGNSLFALVVAGERQGLDSEAALRAAIRRFRGQVVSAEAVRADMDEQPGQSRLPDGG